MAAKIIPIGGKGNWPNLKLALMDMADKYPTATEAIILMFDDEGRLALHYNVEPMQLSHASVMLAACAVEDESL